MKRSELFFGALLVPLDFLALLAAGAAAYYLRVSPFVQQLRPAAFVSDLPFVEHMKLVAIVAVVIAGIFALQGLYAMQATRRLLDEFTRILAGLSLGVMGVIVYIFLSAESYHSRFIVLSAYFFGILFVATARFAVRRVQVVLLRRGYGVHRTLLVGNGRFAEQLATVFEKRPQLGYRVIGMPTLVRSEILDDVYRHYGVDEVIQTDPTFPEEDNLVLLDFCDKHKIDYSYVPNLFETYAAHVQFRQISGVPLMELLRTPLDGWGRIAKRFLDILGASVGLLLLAPLFALIALVIKLDSPGSVFYRQVRVGRNRHLFEICKFRSMHCDYCIGERYGGEKAEILERRLRSQTNERNDGPLFKMRHDPRVTRVGHWLRRTRIDELPQLLNVLRGDMSLVGPRPHLPQEVERYGKHHQKLFTIKPGMTGMAQVHGNAGLPFEQEAKMDIGYLENWSLWVDIILLLKTFKILFTDTYAV